MVKTKTRPSDNFHCFEGAGREFWLAVAKGHKPKDIVVTQDGAMIEYGWEGDGFVVQNGGMFSPQETKLHPGIYYRFFGALALNRHGAADAMAGGWWIDFENAKLIEDWAERFDISLAQAACALLVIPVEWHDCGYVCRAQLNRTLKAWVGQGKPSSAFQSPDSAIRKAQGSAVLTAPPAMEVKQYFLPGRKELISSVFSFDQPVQVTAKGVGLPRSTP